jgi:hypothetical protein
MELYQMLAKREESATNSVVVVTNQAFFTVPLSSDGAIASSVQAGL